MRTCQITRNILLVFSSFFLLTLVINSTAIAQNGNPGHDVNGKYHELVDQFGCAGDESQYGNFHDYGWWPGGSYCGSVRPAGYYVWHNGTWAVWASSSRHRGVGGQGDPGPDPGHDVNGKYHELVDQFGCAGDESQYGNFHDYGWWPGGMYCGSVRAAGYYVWYNGTWAVWASSSGHLGDGGQGDPGPDPGHDVNGKYWDLVDQFGCPADSRQYGDFHDYGWWPGGMYCGSDRPAGYYVWYNGTWAVWSTAVR